MTRFRAFAASVACAGLLLSGCNGDGSSDDSSLEELDPDATPTPTPTPAALKDIPNEPPERPDDKKSIRGAVRFVDHVVDLISYALPTRDAGPLLDLDVNGSCGACRALDRAMAKDEDKGLREVRPPARVTKVTVEDAVAPVWLLVTTIDLPSGRSVRDDGSVVKELQPERGMKATFAIRWQDGAWVLQDYNFGERA